MNCSEFRPSPTDTPTPSGAVCAMNIGPRGRRMRLFGALGVALVTAAAFAGMVAVDAPRPWRLLLFLPLLAWALSLFQATAGT